MLHRFISILFFSLLAFSLQAQLEKRFNQLLTMTTVNGDTWMVTLDGNPKVWKKFQVGTLREYLHSTVTIIANGSALGTIAAPFEGDLAVNNARDTLWIRDNAGWIVFRAGSTTPNLASVLASGNNANLARITSLGAPVASTDAATKGYVDTQDAANQDAANQYAITIARIVANDTADVLRPQLLPAGATTGQIPIRGSLAWELTTYERNEVQLRSGPPNPLTTRTYNAVVDTVGANHHLYFWNGSRYVLFSTTPSGSAGGFLSGTYPNPTALGGTLTGTGGAGFLGLPAQSTAPSSPANGFIFYADDSGRPSWRRADAWVRTLDAGTITANRTWTLPDFSGTVALLERAQTWSGANVFVTSVESPIFRTSSLGFNQVITGDITFEGNLSTAVGSIGFNAMRMANVNTGGNNGTYIVSGPSNTILQQNMFFDRVRGTIQVYQGVASGFSTNSTLASSIFTINSENKGVLIFPRMTSLQFGAISSPAQGLFAYDATANGLRWWNGTRSAFAVEGVAARGTHRRIPYFDVNGQLKDTTGFGYNTGGQYITAPRLRTGFDFSTFGNGLTANATIQNSLNVGLAITPFMTNSDGYPLTNVSLGVISTVQNRCGIYNFQRSNTPPSGLLYEFNNYALSNHAQWNNQINHLSGNSSGSVVRTYTKINLDQRYFATQINSVAADSIIEAGGIINYRSSMQFINGLNNRISSWREFQILAPATQGSSLTINRRSILEINPAPQAQRDIAIMQYGAGMTSHFQGTLMVGDTTIATQNLDIAGDVRVRDSLEVDVTPQHTTITGLLTRDANGWVGSAATGDQFTYSGGTLNVQRLTEPYFTITSTSSPQTLSSTISDNLINQGATQSTFEFDFPPSPVDGQVLKITFVNAINTLTLDGNGNSIIGSEVTVATAGTQRIFKFYTGVGWVRQN